MSAFVEQVLEQATRHPLTGEYGKVKKPNPQAIIAATLRLAAERVRFDHARKYWVKPDEAADYLLSLAEG